MLDALTEVAFEPEFLPSRIEKERKAVVAEAQVGRAGAACPALPEPASVVVMAALRKPHQICACPGALVGFHTYHPSSAACALFASWLRRPPPSSPASPPAPADDEHD